MTVTSDREKRWALFEQKLRERGLAAASIPKVPRSGAPLAASFAQERLLFLDQLTPGSAAYNDHYALRVSGRLDPSLLARVLDEIAKRHEALRTTFAFGPSGEVLQVVHDELTIPLSHDTWPNATGPFESWLLAEGVREAQTPFDLLSGPLSRARLLTRASDEHVLLFTVHHAIWDGWSSGILVSEITALYGAFSASKSAPLPRLETQYADYAAWQRQHLSDEVLGQKVTFWKGELAGAPSTIDIPSDRPRPRLQTFAGRTLHAALGSQLSAKIDALARELGRTPFAVLFATFSVLLSRYSGQRDLVIATPIANRARLELETLIGCFVNTLAIRVDLGDSPTLSTLVSQVSDRLLRAEPHQDLPFEQLVEALDVERDLSRSPIAQVMFVFQNTPPRVLEIAGLTFTPLDIDAGFAKLDLTLNVRLTSDGYATSWEYNTDLFDETTARRLLEHYEHLLQQLLAAPTAALFRVDLLRVDERRLLLHQWNDTSAPYPHDATLHGLFLRQARRSPEALALVSAVRRFSYAELEARARAVARTLGQRGVGPGDLVAVFLRRNERLIPALLGVLMSGAAYVPLDPAYPRERIALILEDTNAALIVSERDLAPLVPTAFAERVLEIDDAEPETARASDDAWPGQAGDRAYVIYTSGSTGKPKGVEIEHRNAVAFIAWAHGVFSQEELRGVLASTSVCFDLSIFEIFGTLLAGGAVILADNALSLAELPARSEVTLVNTVPSAAMDLLRSGGIPPSVRTVNLAGEPLLEDTVLRLYALEHVQRVYNLYGPSETTTYSSYVLTTPRSWQPTIGRPISNTRVYVLDEELQPVPVGVRGELYLGGLGVARGYLGRPDLSAQRFLPDPFSDNAGARMYKTGDVVRWLASGELEYLGRNDHQVKLRGFRIELGEIEIALRRQATVAEAVVVVREDKPSVKTLVAYLVPGKDQTLALAALRASLSESLPEYMVPAKFVTLESLPLSPNGKVDRKRLPAPPERNEARAHVAPRNQVELQLARIWEEVLRVEQVGVHDGFFELGGDSIAAMRVSALGRRAGLELSVSQIFQSPTLELLAQRVTSTARAAEAKALPSEPFGLSPIQRWFFERQLARPHHYNQSLLVELLPDVDIGDLQRAVNWTLQRHSALRLHFQPSEHGYVQRFGSELRVDVRTIDVAEHEADGRQSVIERVTRELEAELDFLTGKLGHVALFDAGRASGALFLVFHHLVVDVVSWHVLLSDVAGAYRQLRSAASALPTAVQTSNYADYVEQCARAAASPALVARVAGWSGRALNAPRMPRDFIDGENLTSSRDSVLWTLGATRTTALALRARQAYDIGIEDVALAALCLALRSWAESGRVVLDVEKHGRDVAGAELDLTDSVGWFTAIFPLIFEAPSHARASLLAIKEALHGASEPGLFFPLLRYGSDDQARSQLARVPERDVVYNFLGNITDRADVGAPFGRVHASSAATNHHPENARSHLLEVTAAITDGALSVQVTFSRNVHLRATVSLLLERFASEIGALGHHLDSQGVGAFSPADFPLARLSQTELDARHEAWWGKIEDAYALTPAQHAILVDVLRDPQAGYYVPQLHAIVGTLDGALLEKSLMWVIQRHTALRTGFAWVGLEQPVQLVFSQVACPISHDDWRASDEPERRKRLAEFLVQDQKRGFALDRAPLLRLFHARWQDNQDLLVWTTHHATSDGWSLPIVIAEVLAAYSAFAQGDAPKLRPARPFRDYIAWFLRQDQAQGEAYFRELLRGACAVDLGIPEDPAYRNVHESTLRLDAATSRALSELAKRHAVTLGVVFQAAWAVVVARYGACRDVMFGSVDSGRPDDLDRVGEMVGMFVTTLPLRVAVDDSQPLAVLLADVQNATVGIREHAHVALAHLAGTASPSLFQSICVIENYPSLSDALDARLGLQEMGAAEITRFPLTVTATTRDPIELGVSASLSDADAGPELLEAWCHVLEQMAASPARLVAEVEVPQAARRRSARAYWQAELADAPVTRLPPDRARVAGRERASATLESPLSESLCSALAASAHGLEVPASVLLLGAFFVLVARYSAQSELLIAVEIEPSQRVLLRSDVGGDTTFEALSRELAGQLRNGRSHFDRSALRAFEDRSFIAFSGLEASDEEATRASFELELQLRIRTTSAGQVAVWTYDGHLFEEQTISRMSRHFHAFAEAILADPERRVRDVPFGDAVGPVGAPRQEPLSAATVLDLFRARVRHAPDSIAVLAAASRLSYAELDAQSSEAAARLNARGVSRGDLVAVHMHRSPLLLVVLLGILKTGAAFVAIDRTTPEDRCYFMVEDCAAGVCVVDGQVAWGPRKAVFLEAASLATGQDEQAAATAVSARDLAYVIYTSGSTGQPKGVMVEHASLLNYMAFYAQATNIGPGDRLLQFASPSFDVSVEEIFGALCFGATLVLRPDDITPRGLFALCQTLGVTLLSLPTAYWNEITRALSAGAALPSSVRLVLIGGERASRDVLREWRRVVRTQGAPPEQGPRVRLLNMYGPTEATISATYADLSLEPATDGEPPIGRPVTGAIALVVDESGQPVPVGVPGELLLGGQCLARGYLNRPELTAQKFTPSSFAAGRLYHTGDLVRWRADAQLEYLGRIDHQIKIRGFRVELGEIESILRKQPRVDDVVVVLRDEDSVSPRIVAYVVGSATPDELRASLIGLPAYMVPAAFVVLDALPVTRSGKIDTRALPAPQRHAALAHLAPRSALEANLVEIWQRVLGSAQVSVDHSFFELGGHSLLATQVVSRIETELGLELTVRDLFEAPTVERLAERLRGRSSNARRSVPRENGRKTGPLSFAQTRLWFLDQLEPGTSAYNMPLALRVSGAIDVPSLGRALAELSRRHAILRTAFTTDPNGQPQQEIDEQARLVLETSTAPGDTDAEAWLLERVHADANEPFDLTTAPLIRARLLSVPGGAQVLVFNLHHIVSDGWSISVLVRELCALYRAFSAEMPTPLGELPIQYIDYAIWQRDQLSGPELERQLSFWKAELEAAPFRLELPRKSGTRGASRAGATVHLALDLTQAERIDALAIELGATPFMVLLAAWAVLLSRVCGQAELIIGTPVANRRLLETEDLIGLFVNTLAIRADLREEPTFATLVAQLRDRLLRAQAHEDLPFEKLVDALQIERNLESSPIFQVMFAMQNAPALAFDLAGLELSPLASESNVAKFDLTLNVERTAQGYATAWEYRTDFLEAAFVERLARHFAHLLQAVSLAPHAPCSRAPLLSHEERQRLLFDWNDTERSYPDALVHELIAAQAERTPFAVAVIDDTRQLTYAALEAEARALSRRLQQRGAKSETRVAVALERTVGLVVALLAIQQAGAVYVPLDPALPQPRMREILEDARVELVLTQTSLVERIPTAPSLELVCIDQGPREQSPHEPAPAGEAPARPSADSLVYILFTSGSTGRPKGVEISHRSLVNFLWSMRSEPGISPADVVLAATNLSFDIAGLELYLPLISGAAVYVASRQLAGNGQLLSEALQARSVTFFQATPSTYKMLLLAGFQGSKGLKLLVGGEPLSVDLGQRLLTRCSSLWNVYGPTETTVWSTCAAITSDELSKGIGIGRPVANTRAYVLDAHLEPVPVGVPGELYLGGQGLARGYASRPDLTAERFLPNPFGSGRIYRTGDIARYREDGSLECFGRVDQQVKVRGFRIELGDIEAAIRRHPEIDDVAVTVQSEGVDDQRLVAYLVSTAAGLDEALRALLKESLPEYMIPAHFVVLDRLPTTPNGKLDRRALPKTRFGSRAGAVAPRDATEQQVAAIFAELLHVPQIGVFDNFFDLGGHSLLGTELIFRLRREFSLDLAVRTLFEAPTVAQLAAIIRAPVTYSRARLPADVVLARQGSGVPWFCFPALAGTGAAYLSSIVADAGASVFLLEAPGLDGTAPLTSVADLASRFAQTIRSVTPQGPVRLLGWSFGAATAFVTARLLSAEGRSVDELVLVDPAVPGTSLAGLDERELAVAFIVDVAESVGKLSSLVALGEDTRARLRNRGPADLFQVAKSLGIFPGSTSSSDFEHRFSVYTASAHALHQFTPSLPSDVYAGKSSILAASQGNGQQTSCWRAHLPESAFTIFEATHYTILAHLREVLR